MGRKGGGEKKIESQERAFDVCVGSKCQPPVPSETQELSSPVEWVPAASIHFSLVEAGGQPDLASWALWGETVAS